MPGGTTGPKKGGAAKGARARATAELSEALDGSAPAGFDSLSPQQLTTLAEAIATARRRHAEELRAGTATALGHVPRLLRGPVRRIVGV